MRVACSLFRKQQSTLTRLKASAHNTIQPICKMPDEVLSNILEVVVPNRHTSWSFDPLTGKVTNWTVTEYKEALRAFISTCSRLRDPVIKTPRCWTFIECILAQGGTRLETVETMLARSKQCRFYLHLELRTKTSQPSIYALQAFSHLLLPHMHRCESLCVRSDNRGTDVPRLIPSNPLRALRHIMFDWTADRTFDEDDQNLDGKAEAVMLSLVGGIEVPLLSLIVQGSEHINQTLQGDFSSIQVQALTRLQILVTCSVPEVVRLLQRSSNLEHLLWVVNEDNEEDDSETSPVPLILNKLVSLRISGGGRNRRGILLTAPQLEQVDLSCTTDLLPFDITHPDHPLLPSLARLGVAAQRIRAEQLAPFLHSHPGIEECYIYAGRPDALIAGRVHSMHLCAAVESFLTHAQGALYSRLRHLSLELHWQYFLEIEPQLTASIELVLHMLSHLQVDLHVDTPNDVDTEQVLTLSKGKYSSRVHIDPEEERFMLWRNPWDKPEV